MSGPIVLALRVMLAAFLYTFLGWALYLLWQEVKLQSHLIASRRVPPLSISIHQEDSAPIIQHFRQADITIGRHPACECQLLKDSISAHHARLAFHHNQWWLEDLGSTNGTYLNDEKLTVPTVLVSGDEVRCGESRMTITFSGEAHAR